MAQCQWQLNFQTRLKKDVSWKCRGLEGVTINRGGRGRGRGIYNWRKRLQMPQCCSSSFPVSRELEVGKQRGECFLNENHGWKVRRMIETEQEMRNVAAVQAEAFYEPLLFFNHFFFQFFQVLDFIFLLHFMNSHLLLFLIFLPVFIFQEFVLPQTPFLIFLCPSICGLGY